MSQTDKNSGWVFEAFDPDESKLRTARHPEWNILLREDGEVFWWNPIGGKIKPKGWVRKRKRLDKNGYETVTLTKHQKNVERFVHRLMLEAFVGLCPPGMQGAHNDGVPTNNKLSNLKWKTPKENSWDKYLHGTHPLGGKVVAAKATDQVIWEIRLLWCFRGATAKRLSEAYGLPQGYVGQIVQKNSGWEHLWPSSKLRKGTDLRYLLDLLKSVRPKDKSKMNKVRRKAGLPQVRYL